MSEKQFIGNAKERETKFGTKEIKLGFKKEDLKTLANSLTEDGWVNVLVKTSQKGTLYMELDTWRPNKAAAPKPAPGKFSGQSNDLPF